MDSFTTALVVAVINQDLPRAIPNRLETLTVLLNSTLSSMDCPDFPCQFTICPASAFPKYNDDHPFTMDQVKLMVALLVATRLDLTISKVPAQLSEWKTRWAASQSYDWIEYAFVPRLGEDCCSHPALRYDPPSYPVYYTQDGVRQAISSRARCRNCNKTFSPWDDGSVSSGAFSSTSQTLFQVALLEKWMGDIAIGGMSFQLIADSWNCVHGDANGKRRLMFGSRTTLNSQRVEEAILRYWYVTFTTCRTHCCWM